MHIAIAGNIGSGKTTLTRLLSKHFGWKPHFEEVDNNPYLESFYEDMKRWSFNLQIYFLNSRFRQVMDIRKSGDDIIQDRTIYESPRGCRLPGEPPLYRSRRQAGPHPPGPSRSTGAGGYKIGRAHV